MRITSLKRSTRDIIIALSQQFSNNSFTKHDVEDAKSRSVLGPLSQRGYVMYNKLEKSYFVTDAGHKYARSFMNDDM